MNTRTTLARRTVTFIMPALFVMVLLGGFNTAWSYGFPESFAGLVEKASPSVVNINVVKVVKGKQVMPFGPGDPFHDFFERYFQDRMPESRRQGGLGTGFIIDSEGYIVTNNHVIEDADEIKVRLYNDKEYDATIVGRDSRTDLALIKIEPQEALVSLPMGDSEALAVGDWVLAIGNPYGLGNTVTSGIVSAKYRHLANDTYNNFIQTDAPINPGNSGGPLLNMDGEVVGINTAIYSRSGGSVGIGFAIPSNVAKDLLPQLKKGKVIRGWLGVQIQPIDADLQEAMKLKNEDGALVSYVDPDGPAKKAGFKVGDIIVAFDGVPIKEVKDLPYVVGSTPVGKEVEVEVIRKGKKKTIEVKIAQLKESGDEAPALPEDEQGPELGMILEDITPEIASGQGLSQNKGVIIAKVNPYSPAAEAGLRSGDVIVEVDGDEVESVSQARKKLAKFGEGDTILLLIERRGTTHFVTVKVQ